MRHLFVSYWKTVQSFAYTGAKLVISDEEMSNALFYLDRSREQVFGPWDAKDGYFRVMNGPGETLAQKEESGRNPLRHPRFDRYERMKFVQEKDGEWRMSAHRKFVEMMLRAEREKRVAFAKEPTYEGLCDFLVSCGMERIDCSEEALRRCIRGDTDRYTYPGADQLVQASGIEVQVVY